MSYLYPGQIIAIGKHHSKNKNETKQKLQSKIIMIQIAGRKPENFLNSLLFENRGF